MNDSFRAMMIVDHDGRPRAEFRDLTVADLPDHVDVSVAALDLGGAALATLPGEPFLWASDELASVRPHLMVAGYSDGVAGYLPTADAYPEGGYEVDDACMYYAMPAPFRRGSLEAVTAAARRLRELGRQRRPVPEVVDFGVLLRDAQGGLGLRPKIT